MGAKSRKSVILGDDSGLHLKYMRDYLKDTEKDRLESIVSRRKRSNLTSSDLMKSSMSIRKRRILSKTTNRLNNALHIFEEMNYDEDDMELEYEEMKRKFRRSRFTLYPD